MKPYNKIIHAFREAWKEYWEYKEKDPLRAQIIKDTIILITNGQK